MAGTLTRARRQRLNRVLTIALTLVVAAGVVMVWVRVIETLREPAAGPRTIGQPGALVWDDRVFTTAGQLKAYLNSQGLSYARWAARHPTAFGGSPPAVTRHTTKHSVTTKHRTTTKHAAKTVKTVTTPAKPVVHRVSAPAVGDATSKSLISVLLTLMLLAAGLVLGGSAAVPPRYAPVALQRFYAAPDRRMVALAAATAILMGFGVSFYLS
jgi:hypothetical protein